MWAALAACGAAYVIRAALHGFDFRPELPLDAVIAVMLAAVLLAVGYLRADDARRDAEERDDADTGDTQL